MTFWSSQTLEANLPLLIPSGPQPEVDCNAVTLTVGVNCYVTPRWSAENNATQTVRVLSEGETITIPQGQFGFLETAETVNLPEKVMGFISFKATYKMQGLVNVSGFHVDPGWNGPLRFALFNAGPNPIHLKQGMQLFLLWVANLDEPSVKRRVKPASPDDFIRMVNGISGTVNSGYDLSGRVSKLEIAQATTNEQVAMIKGIGTALAVGVVLLLLRAFFNVTFVPESNAHFEQKGEFTAGARSNAMAPDVLEDTPPEVPE